MSLKFSEIAVKGNQFVKELAKELGHPEEVDKAGRKLRAVLHTVRSLLTIEESLQMLSQLPMFLKAVYVENWKAHEKRKRIKHVEDFIQEMKRHNFKTEKVDFQSDVEAEQAAIVVFRQLREFVSLGELEDIKAVLPKELKHLISNVTMI